MIVPAVNGETNLARPANLRAWLTDLFIPVWIERACPPGCPGYVEEVRRSDGTPVFTDTRSTLVTGRLLYSFSRAYGFDGSPATLRAAQHGLAFLLGACRLSPGHFVHAVTPDGRVIDGDADLYDLAFVLLGIGGYAKASGERGVLRIADEIAHRLDGELEDPLGGYREPAGTGERRRQFPQMHLFEAFQLLATLDPGGGWALRAGRILKLAERLIDADGRIDEWYAADWGRLDNAQREGELGHHFEWAWMLDQYADASGAQLARELAARLSGFGIKAAAITSLGPDKPIPNAIDGDGRSSSFSRPLWPTIELLRAALTGDESVWSRTTASEKAINVMFSYSIDTVSGLWVNDIDSSLHANSEIIPTRVLYHTIPCIIEYIGKSRPSHAAPTRLAPRPTQTVS
ncbi:AGE family epimerase/isomerase [Ancylobacter pratisalsi]|uniref:N-acylglucosamine 2-epimerase n=1 Tax=Ancylobacter pratisalsi TaxID=1745854 RepID=A0A6P1YHV4_9HYPH|nr:AGE family epimerase/isomerase [Ancylobacter pratisalsi]QIB32296.1 N-acylglucosamine 2-epimerase [Ancylobacter pratisalsi]